MKLLWKWKKPAPLTKHDQIGTLPINFLLVDGAVKDLEVSATTVNSLLMLYSELDHEILVLVAKRFREFGWHGIEPCILWCLDACKMHSFKQFSMQISLTDDAEKLSPIALTLIFLCTTIELSCCQYELSIITLSLRLYPSALPCICKKRQQHEWKKFSLNLINLVVPMGHARML